MSRYFRHAYSEHKLVSSCSGSPEYREGHVKFSPDGNLSLEYGRVRNRQAEINSYKEACDVNNIIKRYENGDQLALLRDNTGVYVDLSQMPKNIHEAQQLARDVRSMYDNMGDDVKLKYPTLEDFTGAFSSQTKFNEFMTFFKNRQAPAAAKEESVNA